MDKYNMITFCPKTYERFAMTDTAKAEDEMWADITAVLKILLQNGYVAVVRDDGLTTWIEFNHDDPQISGVTLEWLGEDEYIARAEDGQDES